jgi:hypothetical protein
MKNLTLQEVADFYGGYVYQDKCVIYKGGDDTFNAIFLEGDSMLRYDTKQDLLDDINL